MIELDMQELSLDDKQFSRLFTCIFISIFEEMISLVNSLTYILRLMTVMC